MEEDEPAHLLQDKHRSKLDEENTWEDIPEITSLELLLTIFYFRSVKRPIQFVEERFLGWICSSRVNNEA